MSRQLVRKRMSSFEMGENNEIAFALMMIEYFEKHKSDLVTRRTNTKDKMFCVDLVVKRRKIPLCYIELKSRTDIKPKYSTLRIGYAKMFSIRDEIQNVIKLPTYLVWWDLKRNIIYYVLYDEAFCKYERWLDDDGKAFIHIHKSKVSQTDIAGFSQHIMSSHSS